MIIFYVFEEVRQFFFVLIFRIELDINKINYFNFNIKKSLQCFSYYDYYYYFICRKILGSVEESCHLSLWDQSFYQFQVFKLVRRRLYFDICQRIVDKFGMYDFSR